MSLRKLRVSSVPRVFFETALGGGKGSARVFWHAGGLSPWLFKTFVGNAYGDRGRVGSLPSRATKLVRSRIMKEIAELMFVKTPVYFIPSLPPRRHERVDEKQPQGFVVLSSGTDALANSPDVVRACPTAPTNPGSSEPQPIFGHVP